MIVLIPTNLTLPLTTRPYSHPPLPFHPIYSHETPHHTAILEALLIVGKVLNFNSCGKGEYHLMKRAAVLSGSYGLDAFFQENY